VFGGIIGRTGLAPPLGYSDVWEEGFLGGDVKESSESLWRVKGKEKWGMAVASFGRIVRRLEQVVSAKDKEGREDQTTEN
jgi:hypothetical protein